MANVQLEQLIRVRRRCERKAPPLAVLQQDIDVLTGEILQSLVRRKLEPHDRDVGRRLFDRLNAARQAPNLDVAGAAHFPDFDRQVGQRLRATEQRQTVAFVVL